MILYIRNSKNSIRKLLETINHFSNAEGHKISLQKSVVFLYINSKNTEKEIMDILPFTIASKTTKYLGIKLTQEVKDNENFKFLKKEIEKGTNNRKKSHY